MFFCEYCKNFKNGLFYRISLVAACVFRQCNTFLGDKKTKIFLISLWSTAWKDIQRQPTKSSLQPLVTNAFPWTTLVPSIVFSANKKKLFFDAKHVSSEFGELIIHTPDLDVVILGFARSLNCWLHIKTERQE